MNWSKCNIYMFLTHLDIRQFNNIHFVFTCVCKWCSLLNIFVGLCKVTRIVRVSCAPRYCCRSNYHMVSELIGVSYHLECLSYILRYFLDKIWMFLQVLSTKSHHWCKKRWIQTTYFLLHSIISKEQKIWSSNWDLRVSTRSPWVHKWNQTLQ